MSMKPEKKENNPADDEVGELDSEKINRVLEEQRRSTVKVHGKRKRDD